MLFARICEQCRKNEYNAYNEVPFYGIWLISEGFNIHRKNENATQLQFSRSVGSRLVFSSSFCALHFVVYSSVCSYPACRLWDMKPDLGLSYFIVKNNTKQPNAKWWNITEKARYIIRHVYMCFVRDKNKTSSGKSQEGKECLTPVREYVENSVGWNLFEGMWCGDSQSFSYLSELISCRYEHVPEHCTDTDVRELGQIFRITDGHGHLRPNILAWEMGLIDSRFDEKSPHMFTFF